VFELLSERRKDYSAQGPSLPFLGSSRQSCMCGRFASERLPSANNDVGIERVEFKHIAGTPCPLRGDDRSPYSKNGSRTMLRSDRTRCWFGILAVCAEPPISKCSSWGESFGCSRLPPPRRPPASPVCAVHDQRQTVRRRSDRASSLRAKHSVLQFL
jgi:hypothetical protein